MVINLIDINFAGRDLINNPKNFKWSTENKKVSDNIFFTDYMLEKHDKLKTDQKKIAWILEPRTIADKAYGFVQKNYNKFYKVLTYDRELLSCIDNGLFCPYGSYWVTDKKEYNKTTDVSLIASHKNFTIGHQLRHHIADRFKDKVDLYGRAYKHVQEKNEALDSYYFSITVENSIQNSYWTEKLLDCFITKTIPIYWGTEDVANFFDSEGIIFFNDIDELQHKLSNATSDLYKSKLKAVEFNYEQAKKYKDPEDYIFNNYNYLLK